MSNTKLIVYLSQFISEHKRMVIERVMQHRTRFVSLVLEDVYHPQNVGAILRTSDCFGVQDVHVIEIRNKLALSAVAMGAQKWLTIQKYKDTASCLFHLKQQGYQIVATTPHADLLLPDLLVDRKTVLVFGNEKLGVSDVVSEFADVQVKIPMFGFTESFNISVSVALCLYDVIQKVHMSKLDWRLDEHEKEEVLLGWLRKAVKASSLLEKALLKKENQR